MNVRMQNQVEYEFHIDDNVLQDTLPRISIQPLVENALNHGLKNQKGKKKVIISAGIRDDDLLISVEDNGIGMSGGEDTGIIFGRSWRKTEKSFHWNL